MNYDNEECVNVQIDLFNEVLEFVHTIEIDGFLFQYSAYVPVDIWSDNDSG